MLSFKKDIYIYGFSYITKLVSGVKNETWTFISGLFLLLLLLLSLFCFVWALV